MLIGNRRFRRRRINRVDECPAVAFDRIIVELESTRNKITSEELNKLKFL